MFSLKHRYKPRIPICKYTPGDECGYNLWKEKVYQNKENRDVEEGKGCRRIRMEVEQCSY